ncbi:hypothetical protein ON010_g1402 [Phytophthora cinnamomi]|nr:hypothetical protein ON010_g1402 [Phytophthora cinnamomi]
MSSGSRAVSRWIQALVGPTSNRDTRPISPNSSRGSTRAPARPIETDEQLARRLQEEEYQYQETAPSQRERPAPERISPNELRRRRLARFGN